MDLENMSSGLRGKMEACETPEEMLALAKEEGLELSDGELEAIAGGSWSPKDALPQCPVCGSYAISVFPIPGCAGMTRRVCHDCGWERNCTPIG